jgi:hypothetical protein
MRSLISGAVGVLFGGFILFNFLIQGGAKGESAYRAGQYVALVMGILFFVGGVYYLVIGLREQGQSSRKRKKRRKRQRIEEDEEV